MPRPPPPLRARVGRVDRHHAPIARVSPGPAASNAGSGPTDRAAPSARLTPSSHRTPSANTSEPSGSPTSASAVPTRTSRRAPSAISSSTTIAVLGPPSPVLWIVSGAPSDATPV